MTLYTPVVLTTSPSAIGEARRRRWKVASLRDGWLSVTGCAEALKVPAPVCDVANGSFSDGNAGQWESVLDWLMEHVHRPLLVVAPLDPLTDLVLWAAATRGWPFAALVTTPAPAATPSTVALLTAGEGVVIPDPDIAIEFQSKWPAPVTELPETPLVPVRGPVHQGTAAKDAGDDTAAAIRVLLVGYYAGPCPTVGVQRINYWFEQLPLLSNGRIDVDLALATPWEDAPAQVHHVPDLAAASLGLRTGVLEPEDQRFLATCEDMTLPITKQVAGFWDRALKHHFDATDDRYDVVICSGNPFPYLAFAEYAKTRWNATTIADYRDPFSLSPRMRFSQAAREDAMALEKQWNSHADVVTVVNNTCVDLVVPGYDGQRIEIIPNGFDERTFVAPARHAREETSIRFVNAGQLFAITPPDALLRALSHTTLEFHQIGTPLAERFGAQVVNHGRMSRADVLAELSSMDCGVAYVTASGLETPTKVFDYLAAGLDVLVLHRGGVEASALAAMLDGVEGIHWVHDTEADISSFLKSYTPLRHSDPERSARFSRRHSTLKLISLLDDEA